MSITHDSANTTKLSSDDDCVIVHLFGATVISWKCGNEEQLFVSKSSKFDGSKAVRGGIPLVFPNFGPWSCGPQHGFARVSWWTLAVSPFIDSNGNTVGVFELKDTEETRKLWNFQFLLRYKVCLGKGKLTTELEIINSGKQSFDFTTLLHTYLQVEDIHDCHVTGLNNCKYTDKVSGKSDLVELSSKVTIGENIDRVYEGTLDHQVVTSTKTLHIKNLLG